MKRRRSSLTNLVRTVVLVVRFALWALQASPDLSSNTNTVSDLDGGNFGANLDGLSDDFVTNAEGVGGKITAGPTSSDAVDI